MLKIKFYQSALDGFLRYAVIVTKYNNKFVLCKHKNRDTYEIPGGHREANESIIDTAKRELYEETGAVEYSLTPITPYSVIENGIETFGMLYYAEVKLFSSLPDLEICEVNFFDCLPKNLTYPTLHPQMIQKYESIIKEKKHHNFIS